jgi:hypothetical protein
LIPFLTTPNSKPVGMSAGRSALLYFFLMLVVEAPCIITCEITFTILQAGKQHGQASMEAKSSAVAGCTGF